MITNPQGFNQYKPDPRQSLFLSHYLDPKSETFSNAYKSALKAGYEQEYAEVITGQMPTWLKNAMKKYRPVSVKNDETCFLCKETRSLQKAHLVPRRIVGKSFDNPSNFVILCATHHWCYDHFCLTNKELKKLFTYHEYVICRTLKPIVSEPLSNVDLWKKMNGWFPFFQAKILEVERAR